MQQEPIELLVVDDETPVRLSLAAYLEDEGFRVRTAESAEQAISSATEHPPVLAVVDLRLPGMDGASLILELAKRLPGMKFLIHTGSTKFSLSDDLKSAGLDDSQVFFKPVLDMGDMAAKILQLVQGPTR
ncbi:Photosynthetic apparatus regulatory protein RegA [Fundidesulfovibrio magnetotacticus]|uniref:Photosynthetic apparatus regulatory protein RegA n=1 Tax=Fundidesulfovibrio magnetotacticus TaxID=2730080 RepID=A0A6V8LZT1_9BACT|nr:response regulator [Fundidesulfovibrio magnetotacticus]GFK96051.1 Photosynthetic apparatus regulatory protein RegA [Fundidesulfovibrio magnetotacticus]